MLTDAISHSILPGIVIAFFITHDLASPLLVVAAAVMGVITVWLVESIFQTGNLRQDAAIGLVFPALFSIGVILIAQHAGHVHLDLDAVLMGELAFAPFDRMIIAGTDVGPKSLWVMTAILLLNIAVITAFYKELTIAAFDQGLASLLGIRPTLIHYSFMALVSITVVGAFDAVGSILVIALFIAPPATAWLFTDRLAVMIGAGTGIGAAAAILGYQMAHALDASISGSMATVAGILFAVGFLIAPEYGVVAKWHRRREQMLRARIRMLVVHLLHHETKDLRDEERWVSTLHQHLTWDADVTRRTVYEARAAGLVQIDDGDLRLTDTGLEKARLAMTEF